MRRIFPLLAGLIFLSLLPLPVISQPSIQLVQIASGLSQPVAITHAQDGRIFIVQKGGIIRIIDTAGVLLSNPFLNISPLVNSSGNEQGMLGLVFHPNYATNGYFFVDYIDNSGDTRLSRFTVSATNPDSAMASSEILVLSVDQPFGNHNGGDLHFGTDGYLYLGLGDGGAGGDPGNRAQNTLNLLGKMLRISVDTLPYSVPSDNPFVGVAGTSDEIWALGLRNPWRWSFDRLTGDMWIGDVGQGAREEINFAPSTSTGGENWGWRCYEGNIAYNTSGCGPQSSYDAPIHDYGHNATGGFSVTGGYVYRGVDYPELQGYYFYGDYGSGRMWVLRQDTSGAWINQLVYNGVAFQISAFGEDADGELYVAYYAQGKIFRIEGLCGDLEIALDANDETCAGDLDGFIDLTVSGGSGSYSYLWSNGAGSEDISNLAGGIYSVIVIDGNGCELTDTAEVGTTIIPQPGLQVSGNPTPCVGDTLILSTDPAPGGYGYQWYNGINILPADTLESLTVTSSGSYYVEYTGLCLAPPSEIENISFAPTPAQPQFPNDSLGFCAGDSLLLNAGQAPMDYHFQWYKDGNLIPGAELSKLMVMDSGKYQVELVGLCKPPISDILWVEVFGVDTPHVTQTAGTNMLYATTASGAAFPGISFQWYLNGQPLAGAIGETFLANVQGTYMVEATDANGCTSISEGYVLISSALDDPGAEDRFSIFPNPADESVAIRFEMNHAEDIEIVLMDLAGKVLQTERRFLGAGESELELDLRDLSAGLHLIELRLGGKTFVEKLMVE